jgi:RimJ/RimL family protein N-acetyltransferase
MDYAFTTLNFAYLVAACDTPNTASLKVCERLNFTKLEEKETNGVRLPFSG